MLSRFEHQYPLTNDSIIEDPGKTVKRCGATNVPQAGFFENLTPFGIMWTQ
jgi:hypothetical protein